MWRAGAFEDGSWREVPVIAVDGEPFSSEGLLGVARARPELNDSRLVGYLAQEAEHALGRRSAIETWAQTAIAQSNEFDWAQPVTLARFDDAIGLLARDAASAPTPFTLAWHDRTAVIVPFTGNEERVLMEYVPDLREEQRVERLRHRHASDAHRMETVFEWRGYFGRQSDLGTPLAAMGGRLMNVLFHLGEDFAGAIPLVSPLTKAFGYLYDAPGLPPGIDAMREDSAALSTLNTIGDRSPVRSWGGAFDIHTAPSGFGVGVEGALAGALADRTHDLVVPTASALGAGVAEPALGCSHVHYFQQPAVGHRDLWGAGRAAQRRQRRCGSGRYRRRHHRRRSREEAVIVGTELVESNMAIEIGHVEALFRYPAKSMGGEKLETANLGWHGLEGDRRLALRRIADRSGFPWLTASRLPELLLFAPLRPEALPPGDLPTHVRTPDGEELDAFGEGLAAEIERRHGAPVQMMHLKHGIFDDASISVITADTVGEIGRLAGQNSDVRRFRPNVVARLSRPGPFQEDEWLGSVLSFGEEDDAPAIAVTMRDVRCSMVNLDPDSARVAPEVMKAVVRANQNNAGIYGTVTRTGRLEVGQAIFLHPAPSGRHRTGL